MELSTDFQLRHNRLLHLIQMTNQRIKPSQRKGKFSDFQKEKFQEMQDGFFKELAELYIEYNAQNEISPVVATDSKFLEFMTRVTPEILLSKKQILAWEEEILEVLENLRTVSPNLPLNKVVSKITDELPEGISPKQLMKLTKFTIETWENVSIENLVEV